MSTPEVSAAGALPNDLSDAYLLQEQFADRRVRAGDNAVGYKIACTNASAQAFIGVDHPCYAQLFRSNQLTSPVVYARPNRRYGVECELAVVIARDVAIGSDPVRSIGSIAIAIEVVEDRYEGIASAGAPVLIADGFAHHSFVLGKPIAYDGEALDAFAAEMVLDGEVVDRAASSTVLGNPAGALRWLQRTIQGRERTLHTSDVVLTGSITPTFWLSAFPAHIECRLSGGLGFLQLTFIQDGGR